mgnify:FL=1
MAKKLISIATLFVLMAVSVFSAFAVEDETKNALVYGDVNIDGIITIVDATIVQKYIVNMAHLDNVNQKLADVDVDAVITIKDATAVQKYIVNVDGYGKTGEKFAAA